MLYGFLMSIFVGCIPEVASKSHPSSPSRFRISSRTWSTESGSADIRKGGCGWTGWTGWMHIRLELSLVWLFFVQLINDIYIYIIDILAIFIRTLKDTKTNYRRCIQRPYFQIVLQVGIHALARQLVTYPDRSSYLIIAHLIVDPHFLAQNDEKHRISWNIMNITPYNVSHNNIISISCNKFHISMQLYTFISLIASK